MATPDSVSGLIFWLKADQITGLIDNDPVSTWEDQSGNSLDVTGAGATRPLYRANIINGLPIVRFDGVDDFMTRAPGAILEPVNYSIFSVFSTSMVSNGRILQYSAGLLSNTEGRGYGIRANTTSIIGAKGSGDASEELVSGTRTGLDPTYADVHYDGAVQTAYDRGTLLATATPDTQGINYDSVTAYSIGILEAPSSQIPFAGDIAEVFVYNVQVSQADREALQLYIKQKWFPFTVTRPLGMDIDDEDGSRTYQTSWSSGELLLEQYTTSGLTLVAGASFGTVALANVNNRSEFIFPYVAPLFGTANFGDRVFAAGRWTSGGTSHLALSTDGGATFGSNLGDGTWGAGWVGAFFADDANTFFAFVNGASAALWRSLDAGSSWTNLSSLPFNVDPGGVSKHPDGRILIINRDTGAAMVAYAEPPDYGVWFDATGSPNFPTAGGGSNAVVWII